MFPASAMILDEKNGTHATLVHAPAEKRTSTVLIPNSVLAITGNVETGQCPRTML
jgi:hypothetical protein